MLAGTFNFLNTSGDTAPPGCALEPTGVVDADGRIEVRKATADDQLGVFVNSLAKVADGEAGVCFAPFPGVVFGVHASDTLAARDPVGTKAGDWYLRKGQRGFVFVGGDPTGTRFGNAVPEPQAFGTGGLTTANTDATEESTTARLEFDKATGVRVDAGATDADPGVVSGIDASPSQTGVVNTTRQALGNGAKRFHSSAANADAVPLVPSTGAWVHATGASGAATTGRAEQFCYSVNGGVPVCGVVLSDEIGYPTDPTNSASMMLTRTLVDGVSSGVLVSGVWASLPVYFPDVAPPATDGVFACVRGGYLFVGIDRDFAPGEYPVVRGGLVVGVWDGTDEETVPPPSPEPPPPPPPPPPGTSSLSGLCSTGSPGYGPIAGRSVVLSGANSATTTTSAFGRYSFGSLTAGGTTLVAFDADPTELVAYDVDGTGYTSGDTAPVTLIADTLHVVTFRADVGTDGVIAGTVADGVDSPLSGRTVTLSGTNTATTTTDGSGGYSFSGLTYGSTTATCSPSGGHAMAYKLDGGSYTGTSGVATFDVLGTRDLDYRETLTSPPVPPPPPGP